MSKGIKDEELPKVRDQTDPARSWRVRAAVRWGRTAGLPLRDPFNPLLHDLKLPVKVTR